ncbi:MAG: tRNA uridine-5-carboxymethylaminomethyl(34) synthesis enzyme MnmG [Clostridia bacterium]|nr:tRNA uridine-5-carboxymethylaminomethyl(34) synthesis enzyme MnmG [Clostridia bacterium]
MECFMNLKAQIAVVGAGHAGIEAALACARLGLDTVLFTINLDSVGNMPCNPSIGGSGKGHLVFEIDALGGEMGVAADAVTLQSRTLNLGKGAAVHSKRVQADRMLYRAKMKETVERTENLRLIQSEIVKIITKTDENGRKRVTGLVTHLDEEWQVNRVIICSGTYLNGEIFIGDKVFSSGPDGLMPAKGLSESLLDEGVRLMRFKTGTPARVAKRSIDLSRLEIQNGEEYITPYSTQTDSEALGSVEQIPCHIVYTNERTHKIILDNIDRSAMYSGNIQGTGPRYCPSIETKLVRFADKERHQLFIEPTGRDSEEMYIQGFSTSMPTDVQYDMLRSLDGFENAEIMRYAYAIEYDCIDPTQLLPTLEFKSIEGLYGAGQFNGTSGYEEAAAQGLVAGINAALAEKGEPPMVLTRNSSYTGTLIDDLVTKGTEEPYRIMTSRSEYRLLLRQDNCDLRLSDIGYRVGLLSEERYARFCEKRDMINKEIERIKATNIAPTDRVNALLVSYNSSPISSGIKLSELMKRPELDYESLAPIDEKREPLPKAVTDTAYIEIKYEGYIKRQLQDVERLEKLESRALPPDLDYTSITGLRIEAAEKLNAVRPLNIGQASRISGVSPADISVLLIYFSKR